MTRPVFGSPTWVPSEDFDAMPSMYGLLNQPTLELLFTQQAYRQAGVNYALTNYPGWSFTRASTGTAQSAADVAAGTWTTFGSGVPRITDLGILIEEARTNSFLNSATGVTQSVTTTAASWTLSFQGTGSITLSGGATGTLNGTGANNRVSLTVTATAASTTLTVTGSITNVQFEAGASASSYIATAGTAVTRAADNVQIANATVSGSNVSYWGAVYYPFAASSAFAVIVEAGLSKPGVNTGTSLQVNITGVGQFASASGFGVAGSNKFAAAASQGHQAASANGSIATGSATWTEGSGTTLFLGQSRSGVQILNGYLSRLAMVASTLSDAQIQALTQ